MGVGKKLNIANVKFDLAQEFSFDVVLVTDLFPKTSEIGPQRRMCGFYTHFAVGQAHKPYNQTIKGEKIFAIGWLSF